MSPSGKNCPDGNEYGLEPIAIIGMACRFPQDATSPAAFWDMLQEGRSAMTDIPADRFNINAFYHSNNTRLDTTNTRRGHFLSKDIAAFDAPFFSIPKHEAEALDPQQRGLLECTYQALENAGLQISLTNGTQTGVFVGCMGREYDWTVARDPDAQHQYQAIGSGSAMLSNRLSWFYDWQGPSITIDTACSSSLVALHLACQSLRTGESSMAAVGGANIIMNPDNMIAMSNLNFLSPDGICYSFDHRANGYSRGEGFGVLIIKTLSQAIRDKNTVRALIRASHCNQDGRTPGITNPSKDAQVALIQGTYKMAGLGLENTKFFEAHGTGTQAGDVTEATAIQEVFGDVRSTSNPIIIGALKSNIGHLEGASGVASIIKTVMTLETGVIPPNAHFEKVNPKIPIDEWCLKFPTEPVPWPSSGLRRASVNSFGYGGTNAHAILDDAFHYMATHGLKYMHSTRVNEHGENNVKRKSVFTNGGPHAKQLKTVMMNGRLKDDAPLNHVTADNGDHVLTTVHGSTDNEPDQLQGERKSERPMLFNFSASDEESLQSLFEELQAHRQSMSCNTAPTEYLKNLAYTLSLKRNDLRWRSFSLIRNDSANWKDSITNTPAIRSPASAAQVTFVFTGQGAAWWDMGRELFAESVYKQSMTLSNKYLHSMGCEWDIFVELMRGEERSRVLEAHISQPITTALQIALVELLASWGVRPNAVVGHSSGEIAAAYCTGALSHRSALQAAFFRGRVSAELNEGCNEPPEGMLVVALPLKNVEARLPLYQEHGAICIACINSPKHITLSGDVKTLETFRRDLEVEGVFAKRLRLDVAYHSPSMERLSEQYMEYLKDFNHDKTHGRATEIRVRPRMISSVTGEAVLDHELQEASYWVKNMVSRVRFSDALMASREQMDTTKLSYFVEIGPTNGLRRPILETLGDILYSPCLGCKISAYETMLPLIGNLWCHNVQVNLLAVNGIDISAAESNTGMLTDLPQYPFNHSRTYWHESRMNRNIRFRKWPRNPILGTRDEDNDVEAKWKNTLRVHELPWIEDHKINGSRLYPAAGMVAMAVEAARQLIDSDSRHVLSFRIKDFRILKALNFPTDDESLDTELHLHRKANQLENTKSWEFTICSWSNDTWTEACRGTIMVEFEEAAEVCSNDKNEQLSIKQARLKIQKDIASHCVHTAHSKDLYDSLTSLGFDYGPAFRSLSKVQWADACEATATIPITEDDSDTAASQSRILISVLTLEGLFQLPLAAVSRGGNKNIPTMIPSEVGSLWLSGKLLDLDDKEIRLSTKGTAPGLREYDFKVTASTSSGDDVLIMFDNYRVTAISDTPPSDWRRLCFKESWKMDIATASVEELASHCNKGAASLADTTEEVVDEAELVCLYFVRKALDMTTSTVPEQGHLRKFVRWMEQCTQYEDFQTLLRSNEMSRMLSDNAYAEELLSRIESSGPEGKVYTAIGRNLPGIINGEIDIIELLFGNDLLQRFYAGNSFLANYERMRAYVDLLAHKNPNMSVLEIGAGTGGATAPVMEALGQDTSDPRSTPRYNSYDYTDISAGFFAAARQRFSNFADRMKFKVLDIEKSPEEQNFQKETYDLIIASCVLHATSDINRTLQNARSLLKPGGKLLLFEPTNPTCARLPFVFGLLEGWWLAKEESRTLSPLLQAASWGEALRESGFSGSDLCLKDYNGRAHTFSVIVSTATTSGSDEPRWLKDVTIFADPSSELQIAVAAEVKSVLQKTHNATCTTLPPSSIGSEDLGSCFCVSLLELDVPLLHQIKSEDFVLIKEAAKNLDQVLWVMKASDQDPVADLTTGFARSLSSEVDTLKISLLTLRDLSCPAVMADRILRVVHVHVNDRENEYTEREGQLCVNRIIEDNALNDIIFRQSSPHETGSVQLSILTGKSLRLTSVLTSRPDGLHFIEDDCIHPLGDDEVEIAVKAVGISKQSSKIAFGEARGTTFAQECAGTIARVGGNVPAHRFAVGDRVCCLSTEAFKTKVNCHINATHAIPDNISFTEAATVPFAWCIAFYSLYHLAQVCEGESVLIENAVDGVGQAILQLAQLKYADVFATVCTEQEKAFLVEKYGLREDHIFFVQSGASTHSIKRMTGGRGVDVVIQKPTSNEYRPPTLEYLAPFGRLVNIDQGDPGTPPAIPLVADPPRNATIFNIDIIAMISDAPKLILQVLSEATRLYSVCRGKDSVSWSWVSYPIAQVEKAFRYFKQADAFGCVSVELKDEDTVPVINKHRLLWSFEAAATYIIAGGTGGLGRSIARWMISRGAKNIVLLGRSGSQTRSVKELINEGERKKVKILAKACNVSEFEEVRRVLMECSMSLPSVKGCIQASMVLRDSLLQNMTYEMFTEVLAPKVKGTLNLQKLLPQSMDFFILLSSTTGIFGSRGQSNYAASSTFQNAFAKHLTSQGQKCLSLDLGMMLGVGYAAERQHIKDSLRAAGYEGISESEFHAMLEWACDPNLALNDAGAAHVITGISVPAAIRSKGLDEIFWMRKPIFRGLHQMDRTSASKLVAGSTPELTNYRDLIQQQSSHEAAAKVIVRGLVEKLSKALTLPVEDFDIQKPIHIYGVDSLVAVEIRYWCKKEFDAEVAVFDVLQSKSIVDLCFMVASKSELVASSDKLK